MIPEQKIQILINSHNKKRYINLGYKEAEYSNIISVNLNDLTKGSHIPIRVICDYCGEEFYTDFANFNTNKNKCIIKTDCCKSCQPLKAKEVFLLKYKVSHPMELDSVRSKIKATNLTKYGVENVSQSEDIKQKKKETFQERYGVDTYLQLPEVIENTKQKILNQYGVEYYTQTKKYREQADKTNLEKYGVKQPLQSDVFKDKFKKTMLERYGVENAMDSEVFIDKIKNTLITRYGESTPMRVPEFAKKARESLRRNNGIPTSSQQLSIFELLKNNNYDVYLNYPEMAFDLDIALFINGIKIDIEYDGWFWHQDRRRDAIRNDLLIKNNWYVIRILSAYKIPDIDMLTNSITNILRNNTKIQFIKLSDWKLA